MDAYLLTAAKISIHFGNLVVFQAGFLVGQSELFLHVLAQGILVYKHVDSLGTYVAFRHVQVTAEVIAVGSPRVLGDVVLRAVLVLGNAGEVHQVVIGCHKRFVSFLAVVVTNSPKHDFSRCKSTTCKFLSRDTKSARDKNGTKPRKNKVKNTLPEISLVEYLCFVCKDTNLSLEKRGEIPISLIHNSFPYHCTPNVVIANGFDLKRFGLRKSAVKFCFALCWTFSKTRTGNRTKDLPPLLSNTWFGECLNDRHLKMLNFK